MPFAVARNDGVLTLTLDTPGSRVNVFNQATAAQLVEVMSGVTPATTRAVVFGTAKPSSFINGVGLLLAQAAKTADDVVCASAPAWAAYRAVREAPVPTIAVVRGSCFGCGVEFALQCDYRIATDSHETCFYMTELNDYLFLPVFGSTWNLPRTVGLQAAIDLLLWGERWGAREASARGLVDAVVPDAEVAAHAGRFVDDVLARARPGRARDAAAWGAAEERCLAEARARVAALPPAYRPVYGDALDLLEAGARADPRAHDGYVEHQRREVARSADSVLAPSGKAAYAFFYLRQMAAERAVGRSREESSCVTTFGIDIAPDDEAWALAADLGRRRVPGIEFTAPEASEFRLVGAGRRARSPLDVVLRAGVAAEPAPGVEAYVPAAGAGGRLVELATRAGREDALDGERATRLARSLQRLGFEVARTVPTGAFVSTRLLAAYLGPLLRFVGRGGDVAQVNGALREAGFVRRPHDLLRAMDARAVAGALAPLVGGAPRELEDGLGTLAGDRCGDPDDDGAVMDALRLSLLAAVLAVREHREVAHTAIVDLIARELIDFPRHLCSLCAWLKTEDVGEVLARVRRVEPLLAPGVVEAARTFAGAGREFYR